MNDNATSSISVLEHFLQELEAAIAEFEDKAAIGFIGSSRKVWIMCGVTTTLKGEIVKIAPRERANCVTPGWVSKFKDIHL